MSDGLLTECYSDSVMCAWWDLFRACDCEYVCPSVRVWRENECVPLETGSLIHPYTINGLSNGVMMVWSSACQDLNHLPVTCLPENTHIHTHTHSQTESWSFGSFDINGEDAHKRTHTKSSVCQHRLMNAYIVKGCVFVSGHGLANTWGHVKASHTSVCVCVSVEV